MPAPSSLAYHLVHEEQGHGVVGSWRDASKLKTLINVYHDPLSRLPHYYRGAQMPAQYL